LFSERRAKLGGTQGRNLVLAIAICLIAVLGAAGCGGSSDSSTATVTEAASEAEAASGSESSGDESEVLAGISPPSGSTLLDSKSRNGVVYKHYSTSKSPSEVESTYKQELTSASWSIENSGGSGGGWGPYGGSDYGLTAKREDDYFDLEAGGEDNSTSYFEICATSGEGTRDDCDELSNESNQDSNSGGSESGSESESTESGGS
jgi:hypothetical protein